MQSAAFSCTRPAAHDGGERMRCEELMKGSLQTVARGDTVRAAAEKMRNANVGFLPVVDDQGRVLGAITDRDIAVRLVAVERPASTRVGDVMTHEVVAVRAGEDIRVAEDLMARHHKSRIMCLDEEGRLVGVISLSDLPGNETAQRTAQVLAGISAREAHIF